MAYTCTTCGVIAETPGHLCRLRGSSEAGSRHICRDKLDAMEFFCTSCGRVAEEKGFLCNPSPIDD